MDRVSRLEVRPPARDERAVLFSWLNEGLRNGRPGRLESEFPNVAESSQLSGHVLAVEGGAFSAHALAHANWVQAGDHRFRLGMIGMVYTAPEKRGRGLARRCIETALERLREDGVGLCLLWSELDAFYRRLGFERGGAECFFWLSRDELDKERSEFRVASPGESDWAALERLYETHASRVLRAPGSLRRLAASPECEVRVAYRADRSASADAIPIAYAARGRGDDFPDIVHEWAGAPHAVLSCLRALAEGRDWLGLLCPPSARAMVALLDGRGTRRAAHDLAWFRVLDAELLWRQLRSSTPAFGALRLSGGSGDLPIRCGGALGETVLPTRSFLDWLFGGDAPASLDGLLPDADRRAIEATLPLPLYLWGFDSV